MRRAALLLALLALACGPVLEPPPGDRNGTPDGSPEPTTPAPDPNISGVVVIAEYARADNPGDWRHMPIDAMRLESDQSALLLARVLDDVRLWGPRGAVEWRSSDPSVLRLVPGTSAEMSSASAVRAVGASAGDATLTMTLRGHEATVDVSVVSPGRAPVFERSRVDREDDFDGPQVHFVYAVVRGGRDRMLDTDGLFVLIAGHMQRWLHEQTDGWTWRIDTHEGEIDVSFLEMPNAFSPPGAGDVVGALREREGGKFAPDKKYAVILEYDGAHGPWPYTGVAPGQLAITLMNPRFQHAAGIATHELLHTLGAVPRCAPNSNETWHATDSGRDIMKGGYLVTGVLDWNRDDYFGHGRDDCLDIAGNPYWRMEP